MEFGWIRLIQRACKSNETQTITDACTNTTVLQVEAIHWVANRVQLNLADIKFSWWKVGAAKRLGESS